MKFDKSALPPIVQNPFSQVPQPSQHIMFNYASSSFCSDEKPGVANKDLCANASNRLSNQIDSKENNSEEYEMQIRVTNECKFSIADHVSTSNKIAIGNIKKEPRDDVFDFKFWMNGLTFRNISVKSEASSFLSEGNAGQFAQNDHSETDDDEKIFECQPCGQQFTKQKSLNKHNKIHTEETYMCEVCGKQFWEKSNFETHYRSHETFECDECDFRCPRKKSLNIHMRSHIGEQLYACETCGKKFWQRANLESHRWSHTGYKCAECGCQFNRQRNLNGHTKMHDGDIKTPFEIHERQSSDNDCSVRSNGKCERCGHEFSRQRNLNRHNKKHAGERLLVCGICKKPFHLKDMNFFKHHFKLHTGDFLNRKIAERHFRICGL